MSDDFKAQGALCKRLNAAKDDCPIAWHRGETYDFNDFRGAVAECSELLVRLDAERIAVLEDDAYPFAVALFSILCAGKKAVLPPNVNAAFIKAHPELFEAVLLSGDTFLREYAQGPTPFHESCGIVRLAPRHYKKSGFKFKIPESSGLIEIYTSGSTGESKRVVKTPAQMCLEAGLLQSLAAGRYASLPRRTTVRVAGSVSPRHLYGLTFRIFYALLSGQVMDSAMVRYSEDLCARQVPMVFITSPAFIRRLDRELTPPAAVIAVSAGGTLEERDARAFTAWSGAPIAEIYGSTESGVIAAREAGESWKLFEGIKLENTAQGVMLHSPIVAGPIKLDDELEFESERTFALKGRNDDIVKLEDKRVSLRSVELAMKELDGVADCACVLLERAGRAQIGAVLTFKSPGDRDFYLKNKAARQRLWRQSLLSKLDPLALPRRFAVVDAIPENHMGKRLKRDLLALFDKK